MIRILPLKPRIEVRLQLLKSHFNRVKMRHLSLVF